MTRRRLKLAVRHRLKRLVRAALLRYVRAQPRAADREGSERRVTILLSSAWGMGERSAPCSTWRSISRCRLAGADPHRLSTARYAVLRRVPAGLDVTPLDDQRRDHAPRGLRGAAYARLRGVPSVLFPRGDRLRREHNLLTDIRLVRNLRRRCGILVGTRPGYNVMITQMALPGCRTVGFERSIFRLTPMLHLLPDDELAKIGPEQGWFIFAVVRHPGARLFSGWQSKFLLREPRWVEMYADASWFPRPATTTAGVIEDFHRFVHAMADDPANPLMRDRHFMSQTRMLRPDRMPYSRVYDTTEIPEMLEDRDAHLRRQGWSGKLRMRGTNETPLRPLAAMFPDDVQAAIGTLFGADFEQFGYGEIVPPKLHGSDEYPVSAFDEIARLVERNERIGDLASRAQQMRSELRAQRGAAPAEHDVRPFHRVRRRLANAIRR